MVVATSVVLCIVSLTVVLPLLILFVSGNRAVAASKYMVPLSAVWGILFGASTILSLATFVKVYLLKRRKAVKVTSPIYGLMTRIQIAAFQLAIAAFGVFLCLAIFAVPAIRHYYDDPRANVDPDDIFVRCARFFLIYGDAICLWFVQGPVMKLVMKVRQESIMSSKRSRDDRTPQGVVEERTNSKSEAATAV
jgi:hypothetical protein